MADELIGYVTLEQADEYVTTHFLSEDPVREAWEDLDEDDKSVLLLKSFETIETLPFTGRKTCPEQPNAFPRYPSDVVPKAVMAAQIENAVASSDSTTAEDAAHYGRLWQFGVQSYSIGNLTEHISEGAWSSGSTTSAATGIVSANASRLLKPFLSGSFSIKGGRCV